jgi:hypothetical protein
MTTTRVERTTSAGATKVWDLADATQQSRGRRRGMDAGGPIAAALGGVALCAAIAPGLPLDARWCLVAGAGVVALLVACSAIRRRQALLSLLLALTGRVAPVAAVAITVDATTAAPAAVTSSIVSDASLGAMHEFVVPSVAFVALPSVRQTEAEAFATALVLRLRSLHGTSSPYPPSLQLSNGSIVEGSGVLQGAALSAAPNGTRLVYEVTATGSAFRIVVISGHDSEARVTADSSLVVAGIG